MKKTIVTLLIALVGALAVSCAVDPPSEQNPEDKRIVFGFSQIGAESAWRVGNTRDIKRAAQDADVQLMYYEAEQKQENQIKDIRSLIAYQVDVIAFSPIVLTGWDNVLDEARLAGIPVLVVDRKIKSDPSLYAGFIGTDSYSEGVKAAEFLLEATRYRVDDIRIMELQGTVGSSVAVERSRGFYETLEPHANYEIFYSKSGDFLRSKGREIMENALKSNIKPDVLYSHNDAMTLGAIDAMNESGVRPGKDITIISIDGEQAAIDKLKQGEINCVIECNPYQGDMIMELVKKLYDGEEIPEQTYVDERVFTRDTDFEALGERGY